MQEKRENLEKVLSYLKKNEGVSTGDTGIPNKIRTDVYQDFYEKHTFRIDQHLCMEILTGQLPQMFELELSTLRSFKVSSFF